MTLSSWEMNLPLLAGDLDNVFLKLTSLITNVMQNVMLARPGTQAQAQAHSSVSVPASCSSLHMPARRESSLPVEPYLTLSESWGCRCSPIPWSCQAQFPLLWLPNGVSREGCYVELSSQVPFRGV